MTRLTAPRARARRRLVLPAALGLIGLGLAAPAASASTDTTSPERDKAPRTTEAATDEAATDDAATAPVGTLPSDPLPAAGTIDDTAIVNAAVSERFVGISDGAELSDVDPDELGIDDETLECLGQVAGVTPDQLQGAIVAKSPLVAYTQIDSTASGTFRAVVFAFDSPSLVSGAIGAMNQAEFVACVTAAAPADIVSMDAAEPLFGDPAVESGLTLTFEEDDGTAVGRQTLVAVDRYVVLTQVAMVGPTEAAAQIDEATAQMIADIATRIHEYATNGVPPGVTLPVLEDGTGSPTVTATGNTTAAPVPVAPTGELPPPTQEPTGLGTDPELDALAQSCYDGAMADCDRLFGIADLDSAYEAYGDTCAGRQPEGSGSCLSLA